MLLKDYLSRSQTLLEGTYPREEAAALVGLLCESLLGKSRYTWITERDATVDPERQKDCDAALKRLLEGEPIQYILGHATFYGRDFHVCPDVLIPRGETELMCLEAVRDAKAMQESTRHRHSEHAGIRILDLCTGSGCIAWTMALEIPGSVVTGVDISQEALKVASRQNLSAPGCTAPRFFRADVLRPETLEAAIGTQEGFDLILSNPPYVLEEDRKAMRRNVLEHEPETALFVNDADPMVFNKKIAEIAKKFLYTDGVVYVEINESLSEPSLEIFRRAGFPSCRIIKDLCNKPRFIRATT